MYLAYMFDKMCCCFFILIYETCATFKMFLLRILYYFLIYVVSTSLRENSRFHYSLSHALPFQFLVFSLLR